jgi:hypothetical protein
MAWLQSFLEGGAKLGLDELIRLMNDVKRRGEEDPGTCANEMVKFIKERLKGRVVTTGYKEENQ